MACRNAHQQRPVEKCASEGTDHRRAGASPYYAGVMKSPMRYPSDGSPDPSSEERVVERAYYENGTLRWERAGVRTTQPPALPPGPAPADPVWLEALGWVLGAFWDGVRLVAEAIGAVLMVIGGLALGVLTIVAAVALAACIVGAGYGIGGWIDGPTGAAAGAWIGVAIIVITLVGATSHRGS